MLQMLSNKTNKKHKKNEPNWFVVLSYLLLWFWSNIIFQHKSEDKNASKTISVHKIIDTVLKLLITRSTTPSAI